MTHTDIIYTRDFLIVLSKVILNDKCEVGERTKLMGYFRVLRVNNHSTSADPQYKIKVEWSDKWKQALKRHRVSL